MNAAYERLQLGILKWYSFENNARIACVGIPEILKLELVNMGCLLTEKDCDYVIAFDTIKRGRDNAATLKKYCKYLKKNGRLLLICENQMGMKFFCGELGEKEHYTRSEYIKILKDNGFTNVKTYSVFPDIYQPQLIYAEDYEPEEKLVNRYIPKYKDTSRIYRNEAELADMMSLNHVIHSFANGYFIEASQVSMNKCEVESVTLSLDRGMERALITLIYKEKVVKKCAFDLGKEQLMTLATNMSYLKKRGIRVIDGILSSDKTSITMPRVKCKLANNYLQELLISDREEFLKRLDEFYFLIQQSADIIGENECGAIQENGFPDLVPLNCFWSGDGFIVFDQEYRKSNMPLNLIMLRSIVIIYDGILEERALVSRNELYERYDMVRGFATIAKYEREFNLSLRDDWEIQEYNEKHQIYPDQIEENRNRIFSIKGSLYIKTVIDECKRKCLENISSQKIWIWGSGRYAEQFIRKIGKHISVVGVIDSDRKKQGKEFCGHIIEDPTKVWKVESTEKIVVCVKDCEEIIIELLSHMDPSHIGIFDPYAEKSKVGYISGTFDMFHIGHVNLLRRAKERCGFLIVGVTSDEYVRKNKGKEPIIPCDERIKVISACKYVDVVDEIPYEKRGTMDAYEKYVFDCQFVGSDCQGNEWWMEQKSWLEERNSTICFLPYTEQTSSTQIRKLIEKNII